MKDFIKNQDNYKYGLFCEFLMVFKMMFFGFLPVKHRYKVKTGEVDIIMRRFNEIVFLEVKGRRNSILDYDSVVFRSQWDRILKTADYFVQQNPQYSNFKRRFDIVIFEEGKLTPIHIKNVSVW